MAYFSIYWFSFSILRLSKREHNMRGLVSLQIAEIELTIQARHKKFNGPSF
jgi:hypothetical protein